MKPISHILIGLLAMTGLAAAQWRVATEADKPSNDQSSNQSGAPDPQPPVGNYDVPAHLTIKQGTYVTVRVNQWLSSDRNQQGDAFTATLEQPIVVDGIVVAQRGQTVAGRVSELKRQVVSRAHQGSACS